MKRLAILSKESVFGGIIKSGVAEMVDGLAISLSEEYEVSVICMDGEKHLASTIGHLNKINEFVTQGRFMGISFFLIKESGWPVYALQTISELRADIFHNFDQSEYIQFFSQPHQKSILTITDLVAESKMYTIGYDYITTSSKKVAEQSEFNPPMVIPGVLEKVFGPTYGRMLPARYDKTDLSGKEFCSRRLHQQLHIPNDVCIYLTSCLCAHDEGEEYVLDAYRAITETNGYLIIVSENGYYEDSLSYYNNGNILFMKSQTTLAHLAPLMAGADFYLQLCSCESDGVAPLEAAMYGTIPIISETSEVKEELADCAIVSHNGEEGILEAARLYENKDTLSQKRQECMNQDFSWEKQKRFYMELYEE